MTSPRPQELFFAYEKSFLVLAICYLFGIDGPLDSETSWVVFPAHLQWSDTIMRRVV